MVRNLRCCKAGRKHGHSEAGLADIEGEACDLGGRFIMPGIIDSHVHVTLGCGYEFADMGEMILGCSGKDQVLDYIRAYVRDNPSNGRYRFVLEKKYLKGAQITKEDLDAICPDTELQIQEGQMHSIWVNSKILQRHSICDDTLDPVPGLSFYTRDENGHVTGEMSEGATELSVILDCCMEKTDAEIDAALQRWIDYSISVGVNAVFDAGIPASTSSTSGSTGASANSTGRGGSPSTWTTAS